MVGRPRVREWVAALVLFVGGFAGRLVLDATPGDPVARFGSAFAIQCLAYGVGLALLAKWWLRDGDVSGRGMLGCVGWLALAALSAALILSSGYK